MADQNLRVLLEHAGDRDGRQSLRDGVHRVDHVGTHETIEPAGRHQQPAIDVRAALHDRHVETVFGVSAIGLGLIEPAMLRLGEPVRAVAELGGLLRLSRRAHADEKREACCNSRSTAMPTPVETKTVNRL